MMGRPVSRAVSLYKSLTCERSPLTARNRYAMQAVRTSTISSMFRDGYATRKAESSGEVRSTIRGCWFSARARPDTVNNEGSKR